MSFENLKTDICKIIYKNCIETPYEGLEINKDAIVDEIVESLKQSRITDLRAYLNFVEDDYNFHSDEWHDSDTDEPILRQDLVKKYLNLNNKNEKNNFYNGLYSDLDFS